MGRILMFSGGMDSVMLKHILNFKDEECLFVNIGTVENTIEEQLINIFYPEVKRINIPLAGFSLPNNIIPFRNNMLALIAAQYASAIYFGFTQGDTTKDKDFVFKAQMESILNYFALDTDKVHHPGPYEICMPLKSMTKTEIVRRFLHSKGDSQVLRTMSTSCYNGNSCGVCRSCLRRYVALTLNNVDTTGIFLTPPSVNNLIPFYKECILKGRQNESKEVLECIQLISPSSVQEE